LAAAVFLFGWASQAAPPEAPNLPPLTTVSGSPRLPGKFIRADLVTDDVAAPRKFYGPLFGWVFRDFGNYSIAIIAERPVAGLFQMPRPAGRPEARPRWFGYISVPNVERAEPPSLGPRPTPMPSIPSAPRPSFRR
jgi:hypothetical protein